MNKNNNNKKKKKKHNEEKMHHPSSFRQSLGMQNTAASTGGDGVHNNIHLYYIC